MAFPKLRPKFRIAHLTRRGLEPFQVVRGNQPAPADVLPNSTLAAVAANEGGGDVEEGGGLFWGIEGWVRRHFIIL